MNFTIDRNALLKPLGHVYSVVERRNTIPILSNVLIETNRLGVFRIRNKRLKRLELIYSLHEKGLSNKEISEYLNNKNLKTFRTNDIYTPKLIWMTLKKYNIRLLRKNDNILQIRESLCVTPTKEINK